VKRLLFSAVIAGLLAVSMAQAAEWAIDPYHSTVGFSVKHMMVSTVHGSFTKYTAKVDYDDAKPASLSVEATIDAASVNTGIDKRDNHLRSADFFDVEKFPNLTFKSTKVEPLGEGKFNVTGDLMIHGVTKSVVLKGDGFTPVVKGMQGKLITAAHAETTIKRSDFGLKYNAALEAGGVVVSDEVKIILDFELDKK